jgi:hypothetical protein
MDISFVHCSEAHMQSHRRSALRLLLAGLAAGACIEPTRPATIPEGPNAAVTAAVGGNNQKVKIKQMQLSSNTLRIGGPAVGGQVSVGNSGLAIENNVVLRGEITQGAVSRQAVNTPTQCPSAPPGKLPTGTCDMPFTAVASTRSIRNVFGIPNWQPADATFRLELTSDDTLLDSKSVTVVLR